MYLSIDPAIRSAMAQPFIAAANGGTAVFFDGDRPASIFVPISSQVALGTLVLADPCATVADGVITFLAIAQDPHADADGAPDFCRFYGPAGNAVFDVDVSAADGDGLMKMTNLNVEQGGPLKILSLVLIIGG